MIVSEKWLQELVNISTSPEEFVENMSLHSTEIETYNALTKATKVVIGKVLECIPHPDSNHLHVCKVDIGKEILQIVCGAPNCTEGIKVIVALVGCELPNIFIKQSVIRGVESNGMLCSLQELGINESVVEEKYKKGIYIFDEEAPIGVDALKYLELDDEVYELGLTPNRMDLLSMNGVAQDVSCIYQSKIKPLVYDLVESPILTKDVVTVTLNTPKCLSYVARVVRGVTIKDSPNWLKARLMASGVRPINNVVDISNYIMLLFGQPLHFFDEDLMKDDIVVRMANDDEKCVTIDEKERTLNSSDIVITDGESIGCIAGVMGCLSKSIHDNTKNILIESAVFDSTSIRKTSSRLLLRSEASTRYERGVDISQSEKACEYACYLLQSLAGGVVLKGCVHEGIQKIEDKAFDISEEYVRDYLGISFSKEKICDIFTRLGFTCKVDKSVHVLVPSRRMDITIPQDLIEELGRMNGYDSLLKTFPVSNICGVLPKKEHVERMTRHIFSDLGMRECVSYALVSKNLSYEFPYFFSGDELPIELLHPLSEDHSTLRRSLIPSLVNIAVYNNYRKNNNLALFEIGRIYQSLGDSYKETMHLAGYIAGVQGGTIWQNKSVNVDFFYLKGLLETYFKKLNLNVTYSRLNKELPEIHPGQSCEILLGELPIGFMGALHPEYEKNKDVEPGFVFEINLDAIIHYSVDTIMFQAIPKVPAVYRDFAFVMATDLEVGKVIDSIYHSDRSISQVDVFDVYSAGNLLTGTKSVAMRVTFTSDEQLTNDAINEKVSRLLHTLEYLYHITLRE